MCICALYVLYVCICIYVCVYVYTQAHLPRAGTAHSGLGPYASFAI